MQAFTVEQWAIIALVFVAGWLLGLASHPGGRKWRERYAAERDAHAGYRKDADARLLAAETQHRDLATDHQRVVVAPVAEPVVGTRVETVETVRPVATRVIRPGDTGPL